MKRKRALVGFALVGLVVLGTFSALARCASNERPPVAAAPAIVPSEVRTSEPVAEAPAAVGKSVVPAAPPSGAAPASGEPMEPATAAASGDALTQVRPTSSAGSRIARALAASHPADLELLGRIERELKREPPPEVHAMLRRRSEGATRDELLGMARALPDLQLRLLSLAWVDQVRPTRDSGARPPAVPAPGSGAPLVKPITPAP
jgi:hypothetical protein